MERYRDGGIHTSKLTKLHNLLIGVVRTRGTEPFQLDMEYVLYVKAEDQNGRDGNRWQGTPEERLSIVGGKFQKRKISFFKNRKTRHYIFYSFR